MAARRTKRIRSALFIGVSAPAFYSTRRALCAYLARVNQLRQIYSNGDPKYLPDDTILWRYMPLQRLSSYLDGNVFLPSVAKLRDEDPFEGAGCADDVARFRESFRKRYRGEARDVEKWMHDQLCSEADREEIRRNQWESNAAAYIFQRHYFDFISKTRFVWCWFKSPHESAAMWSTYGRGGVAVGTELARLKKILARRQFLFGEMRYVPSHAGRLIDIDSAPQRRDAEDLLLHPYFWKRIEYEHEHEVRFITTGPPCEGHGTILPTGIPASDWITKVRLWPRLSPTEEKYLTKAIQYFVPRLDCRCSDLYDRNSQIKEEHDDLMRMCQEEADAKWSRCSDGIPPGMKEL